MAVTGNDQPKGVGQQIRGGTVSGRMTPKNLQDGVYGYESDAQGNKKFDAVTIANSNSDEGDTANGANGYGPEDDMGNDPTDELPLGVAVKLARDAYDASTNWLEASRRRDWQNSLRAFQSLHPLGSKYHSTDYKYRSALYRPKSRAMVRKAEQQTAAAFFSNEDVVNVDALDDDDPQQKASADFFKALLQYRLTKTIPWFLTVVGARQDCDVMGVCIAKTYWRFQQQPTGEKHNNPYLDPDTGMPVDSYEPVMKTVCDKPQMDLVAPENFRFDPGSDWRDPINTSPYLIELIPMRIGDVVAKIETGEWNQVAASALRGSASYGEDSTRRTRDTGRMPSKDNDSWKPNDYELIWVHANIVQWNGRDWFFYSLHNSNRLLTDPKPLEQEFFHGVRPYVLGMTSLETHKAYPGSKLEIVSQLQQAANDEWNLRYDNIKLALNPRQIIKTGSGLDANDAIRMMPGKVMLTNDPDKDIKWDRPPDVSQSAFAEQDRINSDFTELVGDNPSAGAQMEQQSATGTHLMSGVADGMTEYELKLFVETFVAPVLQQLIKLEQAYETDPVVLAIAGKSAKLVQKYGINEITDNLLDQELTMRVNVGIGATNPATRLKNFTMAGDVLGKFFGPSLAMGAKFDEVCKEVFGYLGYKDGLRFFQAGFSPQQQQEKEAAQKKGHPPAGQQNNPQELQQQAQIEQQARQQEFQNKMQLADNESQNKIKQLQIQSQLDMAVQQADYKKTEMQESLENQRTSMSMQHEAIQNSAQRRADWMQHRSGQLHDQQQTAQQAAMQPRPLAGGNGVV